jgi:glycosyltransferase involved in cell wall biosynthesis
VELVVIGDGPARESLEARAARLGIADRVHWLGYVADRATYMDALASCDLFVFPSPAEGFPKVILDAMAAGLPVVATPTGQLERLTSSGLLEPAPPDDRAGLAAAIARVAGSDPLSRGLATREQAFAAAHTRAAETERLVELWRTRWPKLPFGA